MDYRDNSYFNESDTYEFVTSLGLIYKSKANFQNGYWWLNNYYKATTVKCKKVESNE